MKVQWKCFFWGHEWVPSRYATCSDTHLDCLACGAFKVKDTDQCPN